MNGTRVKTASGPLRVQSAPVSPDRRPLAGAWRDWTVVPLALAAVYAALGWASVKLAIPPTFASPFFPSAGVALVALLVYGRRALPGIALGSVALSMVLRQERGLTWAPDIVEVVSALGACAQAGVGAVLVRRFVRQPLTLSEPVDFALFSLCAAPVASLVDPTLWFVRQSIVGAALGSSIWPTWLTWWVGDTLGTLVAAPVVLTLIGRPRAEWAPRRSVVGLSMTGAALLLAIAVHHMVAWGQARARSDFERDAANASATVEAMLRTPLDALEALRDVAVGAGDVDARTVRSMAAAWQSAGNGAIGAMGSARLHGAEDGSDPRPGMLLRLVAPETGGRMRIGSDLLVDPDDRGAITLAARDDRPIMTAPPLPGAKGELEPSEHAPKIYRAVYEGDAPPDAPARAGALRGVVFVELHLDTVLANAARQLPSHLALCLVDVDAAQERRRLAGPTGCETRSARLSHTAAIGYAGRQWALDVSPTAGTPPGSMNNDDAWMVSVIGSLTVGLLGALLLTMSGRTRRIEFAVQERTAALEFEVRERAQAEEALRDSEHRFRNLFQHVPIGVVYTDLHGRVRQTNARYCQLLGRAADDLLSRSVADDTHPDDVPDDFESTGQLLRGEIQSFRRHQRYLARDGRTVHVQATVSLLRDDAGRPQLIVRAVEDITEHLRLQDAERAREAAEMSSRAKSDFLSRMSHELRTPLNAMLGFAQLLEVDHRHPLAAAHRPWVSQIQDAGWHLLEMINDVLDLSRIDSGNLRLTLETLHLPHLLSATLLLVEQNAARRGIVIQSQFAGDAERVHGDATRVKQILTNLLTNAVKYNVDGGRIHVASRRDGEVVELAVTDTGLGMTDEQLAELFQPFNRLGRERSSTQEGTGIGLVISRRLAELMEGELHVRSMAGEGSSFILRLPAASAGDSMRAAFDNQDSEPADYHRRHVHYVEDNETNVEVMRGILAQRPQIELTVSMTGLDGLAAIRTIRPDIVLLDMHLPDISGMELLERLKSDASTHGIPVVVVSADALAMQIDAALGNGAVRYLTKPVNVARTLQTIDELLDPIDTRFG